MPKSREDQLLAMLKPFETTSIHRIAGALYISEATARRCVKAMAARGLVIRTHGGCLPIAAADPNPPLAHRLASGKTEKRRLAEAAAAMVGPGEVIFLDSSSTVCHMAEFLAGKPGLAVVTSGLECAQALAKAGVRTMCLGGFIDTPKLSANSAEAIRAIGQINADWFFFSCDALSDAGELSDNSHEECILRQEFMRCAARRVLLADHTKLGRKCRFNLAHRDQLDAVIRTDENGAVTVDRVNPSSFCG